MTFAVPWWPYDRVESFEKVENREIDPQALSVHQLEN